jgi:hypothetical protein
MCLDSFLSQRAEQPVRQYQLCAGIAAGKVAGAAGLALGAPADFRRPQCQHKLSNEVRAGRERLAPPG